MSATVYHEPYRLPAGILALAVHSLFFALLYFGFSWNRQAYVPATMSVELWSSIPDESVVTPPRIEVVPPPTPPEKVVEPDIAIPEKKKPVPVQVAKPRPEPEKKKPVSKAVNVPKPKPVVTKPAEPSPEARLKADEQAARQQAELAKQAEQAAAEGRIVDEYQAKIQTKIRRNVVMPPNVASDARAEFQVTLLPGGSVLKAELVKSSGNTAYDDAVERAILKSDPLPVPPDVQLFNRFRELDLVFRPTE